MCKRLMCLTLFTLVCGWAEAQAGEFEWIRAAYWDQRYPSAWGGAGDNVRDALQAAGYTVLNADELKTWMTARIADKKLSVVVFCKDVVPDTVVESQSASCTLRKYLDAGGKIVWYADIPFYYWGHADGAMDTWGDAGAPAVLGFNTAGATRETYQTVTFTPAGIAWGLTVTWSSRRPAAAGVTPNLTILAKDNAGNAPAWVKHYVANDTFRGFVRFWDAAGTPDPQDIMRVAEYIGLKAWNPEPANGATGVTMPLLTWSAGPFGLFHDVYLGTTADLTATDLVSPKQMFAMFYYALGLQPGTTYYWRIDEIEADGTVRTGDLWHFTAAPTTAYAPTPRNGDKWIDPNTDLSWQAGQGATQHDVYFSTDQAAVANRDVGALKSSAQVPTVYKPGKLAAETTYFWAVDETTMTGTKYAGDVWRFTTTGGVGGVKGEYFNGMTPAGAPALTRIDPAIDFSWGDPGGPGAPIGVDQFSARWTADLEIAIADTYTFITNTDDGARLWLNDERIVNQWVDQGTTDAPSAPIALEPGIYSLRMEYYENGGGAVARLFWQTPSMPRQIIPAGPLQPPVRARAIYPASGDVNVPQDVTLIWSAGENAAAHAIYFGEDAEAVANATPDSGDVYRGEQAADQTSYSPDTLEWNKTYYWRIDEVNDAATGSPWKGAVNGFTTADFIVVDDFESYNDEVDKGTRIYETWIDGLTNQTTSTVGNWDPPFAERVVVHGGKQAMPLDYNNINSPFYAEGEREFSPVQNWKVNEVTDLTLWVHGRGASFAEIEGGKISMSGAGTDIWDVADEFRYAYKTLNGDGTMVARVTGRGPGSNTWAKAGVMIRDGLEAGSTHAMMVATGGDGGGANFQWRPVADGASSNSPNASPAVAPPVWVKIERKGNNLSGYLSADGATWTQLGTTQTITMTAPVYIGLAVTSHAAGELRSFEFDSVSTTGNVTGAWKVQDIGVAQPSGNGLDKLYLVVEDSAGKTAIAKNPDAGVVLSLNWNEWKIPLSDLAGVNLAKVKKLYIGVGDRKSPAAGGGGRIYIDDIRVTKPVQ